MQFFVLLRSLFFIVLLTAITIFLAHSQLCINYTPHNLEGILKECEESIRSIPRVNEGVRSMKSNFSEADKKRLFERLERQKRSNEELLLNETSIDNDLAQNFTQIEQWHSINLNEEIIHTNVRTCFDFSIHDIFGTPSQKLTDIVAPLRLTIILIITSFLLGVLDMSSRVILHTVSLIQCLCHSFAQIALWGYILVNIEIYRRQWAETWLKAGQAATEVPMYPSVWFAFELHAFIAMMLSILDAVLFNYLPRHIRLLNSQGVYRCIQSEQK